jgi:hypothetical protein
MRLHAAGISLPNHGRRVRRARFCLAAVSGIAVLLAAGCSTNSNGGGTVSSTITIAAVPGIADAPLYLARK